MKRREERRREETRGEESFSQAFFLLEITRVTETPDIALHLIQNCMSSFKL
jgi:hypothetical protein